MKDHKIHEHLNKIAQEEYHKGPEEDKYNWIKVVIWFLVGIFLILLIISFVFVTYPTGNIIEGRLESNPVRNNIIDLNEFDIIFEENSLEKLQSIYFDEQKVEFSVCLTGRKLNNNYHINDLYKPVTYSQSFNSVSFEPCNKETLIILHSHPYKSCIASQVDINMLRSNQQRNKDVLMVVMCEPDRFSVYN